MARLIAQFSMKVPAAGDYSSQQASASIEVELEGESPEAVKAALRRLYAIARESVDEQLAASGQPQQSRPPASGQSVAPKANGNGNAGSRIPSTQAQRKAIYAIAKSKGLDQRRQPFGQGGQQPD